jgi:hypothetical protein
MLSARYLAASLFEAAFFFRLRPGFLDVSAFKKVKTIYL